MRRTLYASLMGRAMVALCAVVVALVGCGVGDRAALKECRAELQTASRRADVSALARAGERRQREQSSILCLGSSDGVNYTPIDDAGIGTCDYDLMHLQDRVQRLIVATERLKMAYQEDCR